jgi:hypothetical protein
MEYLDYFPIALRTYAAAQTTPLELCVDDYEHPADDKYALTVLEHPRNDTALFNELWKIGFVIRDHSYTDLDKVNGTFEILKKFITALKGVVLNEYLTVWGVKFTRPEFYKDADWFYWTWDVTFGVNNKSKMTEEA